MKHRTLSGSINLNNVHSPQFPQPPSILSSSSSSVDHHKPPTNGTVVQIVAKSTSKSKYYYTDENDANTKSSSTASSATSRFLNFNNIASSSSSSLSSRRFTVRFVMFCCIGLMCVIVIIMIILGSIHAGHNHLNARHKHGGGNKDEEEDLKVNGLSLFGKHNVRKMNKNHKNKKKNQPLDDHHALQNEKDSSSRVPAVGESTTDAAPKRVLLPEVPTLAPPIVQEVTQETSSLQEHQDKREEQQQTSTSSPQKPPRLVSSRMQDIQNSNKIAADDEEDSSEGNNNNNTAFFAALKKYDEYLQVNLSKETTDHHNFHFHVNHPEHLQETKSYIDIEEFPGEGVRLPHRVFDQKQRRRRSGGELQKDDESGEGDDANSPQPDGVLKSSVIFGPTSDQKEPEEQETIETQWKACDPTDTDFTDARDRLCSAYLRNWNNIRTVKAMSSKLLDGRTIKFRVFYRHGNITAIIKVSQHKFVYEPISEMLAFGVERAVGFKKVPPTAWTPFPLKYLEAAAGLVNPLYAQWLNQFVVKFQFLDLFHFPCISSSSSSSATSSSGAATGADETSQVRNTVLWKNANELSPYSELFAASEDKGGLCVNVTIQLWMEDVHPALYSFLALNFEQDDFFYRHFYTPREGKKWPPHHQHRLQSLGDMCDRFIFDFLTGNTDRGMNDHNNFVYGGCDGRVSSCAPPSEEWKRTKRDAKYAFLDQGSSFYSHKEPEGNPFTGKNRTICRFRRSTHEKLKSFVRSEADLHHHVRPLAEEALTRVPGHESAFRLVHLSVFKTVQDRAEKIVRVVDECVKSFSEEEVLSL